MVGDYKRKRNSHEDPMQGPPTTPLTSSPCTLVRGHPRLRNPKEEEEELWGPRLASRLQWGSQLLPDQLRNLNRIYLFIFNLIFRQCSLGMMREKKRLPCREKEMRSNSCFLHKCFLVITKLLYAKYLSGYRLFCFRLLIDYNTENAWFP